jgi:class 3 adenylate cyclase
MLPTGTVTFLFTDIKGSTGLVRAIGTERYENALQQHRRLLRDAFARNAGHEVGTEGDSFFVAFARTVDAVRARPLPPLVVIQSEKVGALRCRDLNGDFSRFL